MKRIRVYIASPYAVGNKEENVRFQMKVAYELLKLGFNPYVPLYNHFLQETYPDLNDIISWIEIDKEWLKQCDIAIRFHIKDKNGNEIPSLGADEEEKFCKENNIPMYHFNSIEEMRTYLVL